MDNGQNNGVDTGAKENGVMEPLTPQVQPEEANNNTVDNNKSGEAIQTRIIQDQKTDAHINLAAYNLAEQKKEKEEKVFVEDSGAGFRRFLGFFVLIALIAFAFFLPTVSDQISKYQMKQENKKLVDGYLRCKMSDKTDILSIEYSQNFKFLDKRIVTYTYQVETTGSREDVKELEKIDKACRTLDMNAGIIDGVTISCSITSTNQTMTQEIELNKVNPETLNAAFAEAGGNSIEFSAGESVDDVQTKLQRSNYKCEKVS